MSKMFTVQLYDLPRGVQKKFLSGIVSNFNFPPEQTKSFDFFPGLTLTEVYSRYRANLQTAHFKIWQNETVHRMRYFLLVILSSFGAFLYRVSHKTWQLVNSFECLLPYTVLIYKDFLQFILLKKIFYSNIFKFKIIFTKIWLSYNIFCYSLWYKTA